MQQATIRARLSEGFFPSEVTAELEDLRGNRVGFMAARELVVSRDNGTGEIAVRVVQLNDDRAIIELPGDVYGAVRYVEVDRTVLATRPAR